MGIQCDVEGAQNCFALRLGLWRDARRRFSPPFESGGLELWARKERSMFVTERTMSELVSYHLVGRFVGENKIFLQPLLIGVAPEILNEGDVAVFRHICRKAGTVAVCTIRSRRDQIGRAHV